ncbi:rhamnulokinase family protein [Botrimarina sp.]|uniref:rhamnulokinase n=1 Tax=Botrimarina sp. TaxID=2795802 RepID=UPI0032EDDB7D
MPSSTHLAIDLGASGGRAMLAVLGGAPLAVRLEEAHRFDHEPLDTPAGPVWDLTSLWREVLTGVGRGAAMAAELGAPLRSIGVDTWAVDWALVDPAGELLGLPHAYRDPANAPAMQRVLDRLPGGFDALYARTGIQRQPFNTLFQLERAYSAGPGRFAVPGAGFLMLPDLLHYWLCGARSVELTNASSTAMLDAQTQDWDRDLLATLGLPDGMLGPITAPGAVLGPVRGSLAAELGLPDGVRVVAPGTHDTASAVAAVPAEGGGDWAYLSSGTWSLLGVELDRPITSPEAAAVPFTNEIGVGGKVRFLRNIAGLWLIQELRRDLERDGHALDYAELAALAGEAPPLRTLVDPNTADLAAPGDSRAKLCGQAERTGQPLPETPGQFARCCLESLALSYAETLDRLESITGRRAEVLYLVGGGVNNTLLNQLTADAAHRPVRIGPSEATALGNALVQAAGLGLISDLSELRAIVARSQPVATVRPTGDRSAWDGARRRFSELIN